MSSEKKLNIVTPLEPVDFLIITALPEERKAVLDLLISWEQIQKEGSLTYYLSTIPAPKRGGEYKIAVTMLSSMGNISALSHALRAIQDLTPDYVLMVGIGGGLQPNINLGDVIISDQIIYYELAKQTPQGLQLRPTTYPADPILLERAQNYLDTSWRELIKAIRPKQRGRAIASQNEVDVKFGPFATGEKVITDDAFVAELKRIHSKMACVEMESFGVAVAASVTRDRPRFIAIRGISDKSNVKKDDRWHDYAAEAAAAFTIGFLRYEPVDPKSVRIRKIIEDKTLIAVRHQSLEPLPEKAIANVLQPEFDDFNLVELVIDQTDLYKGNRLVDPLEAAKRQIDLPEKLSQLLAEHSGAATAYYAIAHIPLMFMAGYSLSNRQAFQFFELNRYNGTWNQLQQGGDYPLLKLDGLPKRINRELGAIEVRFSVSYQVTLEQVKGIVKTPLASLHLHLEQPTTDVVTSEHQVRQYGRQFRAMLDQIYQKLPNVRHIHLFYAGPPSLAFHCGQLISKNIHPSLVVYNYSAKDKPNYSWGIDITDNINQPDFIVRPVTQ